jgi:hypothetical protein
MACDTLLSQFNVPYCSDLRNSTNRSHIPSGPILHYLIFLQSDSNSLMLPVHTVPHCLCHLWTCSISFTSSLVPLCMNPSTMNTFCCCMHMFHWQKPPPNTFCYYQQTQCPASDRHLHPVDPFRTWTDHRIVPLPQSVTDHLTKADWVENYNKRGGN